MNQQMIVNGLTCTLNMPKALKSRTSGANESSQGLPPYRQINAYPVDEYPACPDNWMHGSAKASSYFVPVQADHGMWLDFNGCRSHTHDVAIVVSIQGINPITGQKQDKLRLEKYKTKCPVCNISFKQDRFCEKCKFSWPSQNYLATTGTPFGLFWLDGFRAADGVVRQYIFTEEEIRGVAQQVIGKDRCFAIGVAFYLSKKPKPQKEIGSPLRGMDLNIHHKYYPSVTPASISLPKVDKWETTWGNVDNNSIESQLIGSDGPLLYKDCNSIPDSDKSDTYSRGITCSVNNLSDKKYRSRSLLRSTGTDSDTFVKIDKQIENVKFEIGAGAKINQQVYDDPENLSYWKTKPAGMIYINYCSVNECERILQSGKREDKAEGFLTSLKTGN